MTKNNFYFFFFALAMVGLSSCSKERGCTDPLSSNYKSYAEEDDGSCAYSYGGKTYGVIEVGSLSDVGGGYDVFIDNEKVGRLGEWTPYGWRCGDEKVVSTIKPMGDYIVKVIGRINGVTITKEDTVNLTEQECEKVIIDKMSLFVDTVVGVDKGDITFWLNSDLKCGDITVTLGSLGNGLIEAYYDDQPDCAADLCANFYSVVYGTYSYTAIGVDTTCAQWNGMVTLDSSCVLVELTL